MTPQEQITDIYRHHSDIINKKPLYQDHYNSTRLYTEFIDGTKITSESKSLSTAIDMHLGRLIQYLDQYNQI